MVGWSDGDGMNFRTIARFDDGHLALRVMKRMAGSMKGVFRVDASTILFVGGGRIILSPSEYHETYNIIGVDM
jgi:hypothetical protein